MIKRRLSLFICLILAAGFLHAQEIITAGRYMEMVSERYGSIRDFEANTVIRSGGSSDMVGVVSFLAPAFLRIDFSRPADQVIVFNSELLTVYLPEFRATLMQSINRSRRAQSIASGQGLSMLRRNYVPSFVTGPSPEPLDGTGENVIRLRLTRTSGSEGFRQIILSINPDTRLIRRIEGRTLADTEVRMDFTNIRINQGIPEQRFLYDPPPSANMYNNFLFRDIN